MTLVDAGPLLALLDRDDQDHLRCRDVLGQLAAPLVTTWPAFTEAMSLLGARAGWRGQRHLWDLVTRRDLILTAPDEQQTRRAGALMEKYRDLPMDLADATLVALAESLGQRQVFTLDADFQVYRWRDREPFELTP
jgi:predicted nucleic acid-binding protein